MSAVVVSPLDVLASELQGPLYSPVAVPGGFASSAQDYFTGRIDLDRHLIIL